jgi:hypothetical protein
VIPADSASPLVVQYLYVHEQGEAFSYPTARSRSSAALVASRYLECALAQAASLRLQEASCDLALATNIDDRQLLGGTGVALIERIESLGVTVLPTPYTHRPNGGSSEYVSSRYVLDAILAAAEAGPDERQLWLTDLDCVWTDARKVFAAAPPPPEIGCLFIEYPPWWDATGQGDDGRSRDAIGRIAACMGGSSELPPWVGGELLTGTARVLRDLVAACERIDGALAQRQQSLPTEEQVLSLAGALGEASFCDVSHVARRVQTGRRHRAEPTEDPLSLGLWHLPGEKGLSLRRTARDVCRGREELLRRDLSDPVRMGRRFNVHGTGLAREVRDHTWLAGQRLAAVTHSRLGRSGVLRASTGPS